MAVLLIAAPLVAMQFTKQVNWTPADFAVFAVMILCVGIPLELAARFVRNRAYIAAVAVALVGAFLVLWANLAVGIVGSEDNPANLMFFAALLLGLVASAVVRFRAAAMSRIMITTAGALGLAFAIAAVVPTDEPRVGHWTEFAGTCVFAALFLLSAWLFRRAAKN